MVHWWSWLLGLVVVAITYDARDTTKGNVTMDLCDVVVFFQAFMRFLLNTAPCALIRATQAGSK